MACVIGSWIGLGFIVGLILPSPQGSLPVAQGIAGAIVFAILGIPLALGGARAGHAWMGAGVGVIVAAIWGLVTAAAPGRFEMCLSLIAGGLAASITGTRLSSVAGFASGVASFRMLRRAVDAASSADH